MDGRSLSNWVVSTVTVTGRDGSRGWSRNRAAASVIAQAQEVVPLEPPALQAGPSSLSEMPSRTRSVSIASASAAIAVSAVRAPVPRSVAAMTTVKVPSTSAVIDATEGNAPTLKDVAAIPVPTSRCPSRRIRGRWSRVAQPNLSAPVRRHATRLRLLNGRPDTGPTSGSLRSRSSSGSRPSRSASSSMADSRANDPGAAPGPRIEYGGRMSRGTAVFLVRIAGAA